ncbi:cytidine deaminase [Ruoffia tabacinasalis]|uniref:Cytidine deaminase n=1 Tax=Ruoffia halotolerans TaxID=2748684 RepID=A0A839A3D2_9LACT|nr:cytidine deaminase [Ruoffia halotolerans]MBA5728233.1 cytidine deaminase [Ruoffia halotolerans]
MKQEKIDNLVEEAINIKPNSYSPYSNFRVGAAIEMNDGELFTGVNIENVSFGATNCAERSAIFTAISQGYQPKTIKAIAVSGDTDDFLPPCSICRQVMVEFCEPETPVYLTRKDGKVLETSVEGLVPFAFSTMDM